MQRNLLARIGGALVLLILTSGIAQADPLAEARAAWREGNPLRAAELAGKGETPAHHLLGGLALIAAGDDLAARPLLEKVPEKDPLAHASQPALIGVYRRLGLMKEARALAKRAVRRKVPGALYLLADVETAARGCRGVDGYRVALKKERRAEGRHAARRMILQCSRSRKERIETALAMLGDKEPIDSELARSVLAEEVRATNGKLGLPFNSTLRVVDKLFFEGLATEADLVVRAIPRPRSDTDRARLVLYHAQTLARQGKKSDRVALLESALKDGAGGLQVTIERMLTDARAAVAKNHEESAAIYLAFAEAHDDDATGVEARHLGGYHLSEAGKLKEAIAQWDIVASQRGSRRKDAAWFAAQKTAELGDFLAAAERAQALSEGEGDTQLAALYGYWAAHWLLDAGRKDDAVAAWGKLCARYPARLHGRFACTRAGLKAPAPQLPAGLELEDPYPLLLTLLSQPKLPARTRPYVQRAAAYAQAGANVDAREELREIAGFLMSGPSSVALAFGEAALALGDAQSAVVMTERRRGDVDRMDDARWLRLAYPRLGMLEEAARGERCEPELVHAIARTESWFAPSVRSRVGAIGLMQIMPATGKELLARAPTETLPTESLWHPRTNATLGARYLRMLQGDFGTRPEVVACGYNAGPRATRNFIERGKGLPLDAFLEAINYRETRGYARKVLEGVLNYRALAGKSVEVDPAVPMDVQAGDAVQF